MSTSKHFKMTDKIFRQIREALNQPGATMISVAKQFEMSDTTVSKVNNVQTFDEYVKLQRSLNEKHRKQRQNRTKGKVFVDMELWDLVKRMIGRMKLVAIERNLRISQSTITRIKKSTTFEEYQKLTATELEPINRKKNRADISALFELVTELEAHVKDLNEWRLACRAEQKIM